MAAEQSDIEKAAAFGDHLRQVFTPHSSFHPLDLVVSDSLNVPCPMSFPTTPFSPAEVSAVIARLNVRKAPGYNLILGKVFQELPPTVVVLLTTLSKQHAPPLLLSAPVEISRKYNGVKTW
jgi:hypothetical protein